MALLVALLVLAALVAAVPLAALLCVGEDTTDD